MDREMKKELRKLLTGRTIRDPEGWLVAVPDAGRLIYHGASDNTGRKIICREAILAGDRDPEKAFYRVLQALETVGLPVNMRTRPEALCALRRYFLTKGVILCATWQQDGSIHVQAYTGRSFLGSFCCVNAIRRLKAALEQI